MFYRILKIVVFVFLFLGAVPQLVIKTCAQNYYWIEFTDKNNTGYTIDDPMEYLSVRAIERRIKQGIAIDSLDLPVSRIYIGQVLQHGDSLVHASKWMNGITVKTQSSDFMLRTLQLPFVRYVQLTKPARQNKSATDKFYEPTVKSGYSSIADSIYYGPSFYQVNQINAGYLHDLGYRGQGMIVAVLDAGYYNTDIYPAFDSLWFYNRVLGSRDFVNPTEDFYSTNYHGMSVLSCMAGVIPGELIGTSPEASYWLLRSEDASSEYLVEEDNWIVAAEFADSVGADVINSSLGYATFDDPEMNHDYSDMDGSTTRVTRGADIAASRGMLVFSSVGNEGNDPWKYLIAPSDGDHVIAVGAVDRQGVPASFTSYGPASDGDVKPNVTALGRNTFLQKSDGTTGFSNGTSFSCPVMAGAATCLWQANPDATVQQVKKAIEQSAHLYPASDSLLGYGIPDLKTADFILKSMIHPDSLFSWNIYPNPFSSRLVLRKPDPSVAEDATISLFTVDGKLLHQIKIPVTSEITLDNLQDLPAGLLILRIETAQETTTVKLNKFR